MLGLNLVERVEPLKSRVYHQFNFMGFMTTCSDVDFGLCKKREFDRHSLNENNVKLLLLARN